MSTDYNKCINCGGMFTNDNYGEAITCEKCGNIWCDFECAIEDGVIFKDNECDEYEEIKHCPYCSGDKVHYEDYEKLDFALKLLGITEEQLINKMKSNKED